MKIEIRNLYKSYGPREALWDVTLDIHEGMFGLLGPNGAGKTTLMRIMTTLLNRTSGSVSVNGIDIDNRKKIRSITGYLPQEFSVYPGMSVYEAMDYLAILTGKDSGRQRKQHILTLLEKVNLDRHLKTKVRVLSGGMKRRLGIAQALLNDPEVLIVDEPTAGLDPEERVRIRNLLTDFSGDRIVILSTHIAQDIESTCESLAVLKEGRLMYQGKTRELLKRTEGSVWTAALDREEFTRVKSDFHIVSTVSEGELMRARVLSSNKPFDSAETARPSVEDAYMKLVKGV